MTPDWHIISVFDPDGGGRDFAYTVGLHSRGFPELFLWARPTDGDDPGADWKLSSLDLGHQLNDLGDQLTTGSIAPGSTIEVRFDDGATTATLRLQPAVAAHGASLDAFQMHPDATVSEVRWSLHRQPIGPRRPLDADETAAARDRLGLLIGAEPARAVTFPADAPLGPHTPVFTALRSLVRTMDDNRAYHLLAAVHLGSRPPSDIASIQAASRSLGLQDAVATAIELAQDDALTVCRRALVDEPDLVPPSTALFASLFAASYGAEIIRHAVPDRALGSSEVLWALFDPERRQARRFVRTVSNADPALAAVLRRPDTDALAATVQDLDDETIGALVSLWPLAAADGHGTGLWLVIRLVRSIAGFDVAWNGAAALATAGYAALGIAPPPELGDDLVLLAERVAADVRATALRKVS
jgi:hypothetical protein